MTYANSAATLVRDRPDRRMTGTTVVVGGLGFLGRQIMSALAGSELNVIGTARNTDGDQSLVTLDLIGDSMRSLRASLESMEPDVVINCTGRTSGSAQELIEANVIAPTRLLAALPSSKPRLVHLGSAAEYGPAGRRGEAVSEDHEARPESFYGLTKFAGTQALLAQSEDTGVAALVLRVFNPVGANCPVTTLPGRTAHLLRTNPDGEPLRLAPLDTYRDFVAVSDVSSAVLASVRTESPSSRIYNIGSGRATSTRDLVRRLIELANFSGDLIEEQSTDGRSAAVSWQQADIARAEAELGWTPTCDLDQSLSELWQCAI